MGLPLSKHFLFIDTEAEPSRIQNFHIYKDGFEFRIFRHVKSTEFDSIMPYDFHYEVKIWIINYLAVFTSFKEGPVSQSAKEALIKTF